MEEKPTFDKYGEKAIELIEQGQNLFITGKAGTGKTTLLRHIKDRSKRRVAVLASTGIAAKNAIGITIHSFLRLPTTPYFPGIKNSHLFALGPKDIEMVKSVEVIIVDEVSMVRCDVLDAMDEVLRHYRGSKALFGGVQMVFFGDLYQLMPVAPTEDWDQLKKYYKSPYFFSSKAFEAMDCPMLELKKVHRQKDSEFIRLLNHVRDGKSLSSEIQLLNTRYKANYKPSLHDGHIVLTTHNRKAKGINWGMLERLDSKLREYPATKSGWFPSDEYPTDYYLQLKRGARVMFVRNDTSSSAEYVNGTLGVVKDFGSSYVVVETDDNRKIFVSPQRWEHQRYKINKVTKQLETEVTGYFIQYPLKLAWAVTIHKSQGMTFDNVVIDAQRAFTYGQVYVALSRCRTLGGIILMTELSPKTIKADEVVKQFMTTVKRVEVEDDEEEEITGERHLVFQRPEDRTLFLVNNGMSIDEIVKKCGEKKGVVYSHLTKLAAEGKIDARNFVGFDIFPILHTIFLRYGKNIDRHKVKELCEAANYGEIELVRAYISCQMSQSENLPGKDLTSGVSSSKKLELNISLTRLSKVESGEKTSVKKAIYNAELEELLFVRKNGKFLMKDGSLSVTGPSNLRPVSGDDCPFILRCDYGKINLFSFKTKKIVQRLITGMSVKSGVDANGKPIWVVTISFDSEKSEPNIQFKNL